MSIFKKFFKDKKAELPQVQEDTSSNESTPSNITEWPAYYKKNFFNLNSEQKEMYKKTLNTLLDGVKADADIINTSTDLRIFVQRWNHMLNYLHLLSEHEYTGYFTGRLPSDLISEIMENKFLTEKKFIERSFLTDDNGNYVIGEAEQPYMNFFSQKGIEFIKTNKSIKTSQPPSENECHSKNNPIIPGLDPYFVNSGYLIIEKDKASIGVLQRFF